MSDCDVYRLLSIMALPRPQWKPPEERDTNADDPAGNGGVKGATG
jgi:hypothetical protein